VEENNIKKEEEETQAETTKNLNYSPVKEKTVVAEMEAQEDSKSNSNKHKFTLFLTMKKVNHQKEKKRFLQRIIILMMKLFKRL